MRDQELQRLDHHTRFLSGSHDADGMKQHLDIVHREDEIWDDAGKLRQDMTREEILAI